MRSFRFTIFGNPTIISLTDSKLFILIGIISPQSFYLISYSNQTLPLPVRNLFLNISFLYDYLFSIKGSLQIIISYKVVSLRFKQPAKTQLSNKYLQLILEKVTQPLFQLIEEVKKQQDEQSLINYPKETSVQVKLILLKLIRNKKAKSLQQLHDLLQQKGFERSISSIYRYVAQLQQQYEDIKNISYSIHCKNNT